MTEMERLHGKDMIRFVLATTPYTKQEAEHAYCPQCGNALKLEFRVDPEDRVGSMTISCEACQKFVYVDRVIKPEWMN